MRRKIVVSLVVLFTIFATGATVASWYVAATTEQLERLLDLHEVEGLRRNLVISVQTVQADLYTAHTALAPKLDAIVANVDDLDAAAEECASCHHPPDLARELDEIHDLIGRYETALSYYITASANRERISKIERAAAGIGDQLLERTEEMSARASLTLEKITAKAASRVNNVRTILLSTLALTFCLGIVMASYLVRSVTNPVRRLVDATRTIASGRLGHRIHDTGEAEFGELARHFNVMSAALEASYQDLRSTNVDLQREISDRKQAEQERETLQSQLLHAQKMEALGTLSAGIAHEFGNFLQIIQGCLDSLASKTGAEGPGRRELEMIGDTVKKAADLTRALLTFGSKEESKPSPVDVNESVRRAKEIFERILPNTIEIEISLAENLPRIEADAAQIEQVLMNLAVNARDAMPDGGRLSIETSRGGDDGRMEGGSPAGGAGKWVVLSVSDTGHGMDRETIRYIFDPFFTTKEVGVGTGLGLATVYGIVTAYGGRITCRSEVDRGSVFEIRLPGLPGKFATVEKEEAPTRATGRRGKTILLVDDEVDMVEVMRDNLKEAGYEIHTANSGEKALELFATRGHEVDLVILDLAMPGMDGRTCLEKLLEIEPDARIIVSTGFSGRRDEEEMIEAGASGFLPKPSRISDILSKVEQVLNA